MNKRLSLLLLTALLCPNCTTKPINWPALVTCAGPVSAGFVADVEAIISAGGDAQELTAEAVAALEQLAVKHGPELVACVLEQLIDSWLPSNGPAASQEAQAKAARAQGFLNDHGVTVRSR